MTTKGNGCGISPDVKTSGLPAVPAEVRHVDHAGFDSGTAACQNLKPSRRAI
ncbi:MAG: hypothetical protein KDA85_06945 [Planctomycetaceae bacterium]|nr:hypothetical protein [Planctomycetaceae bacterium]